MPISFRVVISGNAKRDIQAIHDYIALDKKGAAAKWVRTCYRLMRSLRQLPHRCEIIPEVEEIGVPYRHLLHGGYRIFYLVDEEPNCVTVVRVIHGGRILTQAFFRSS